MKLWSLARAMFSDGMDFFAYRTKPTSSKVKQLAFPLLLALVVMFSVGYVANFIITPFIDNGQAAVVPIFLILLLTFVGLFEGIYKVGSLLYECHDNDLLFSLPIPKSRIFALRVAKLLVFQLGYNALIMLPAFAVYAFRVQPGANFYIFSTLMLFLAPLIPTAIAVVLGYAVKALALGFHHEKISQTILSFVAILAMMFVIGNWQGIVALFSDNITTITDFVGRVYYPVGAYARLITSFSWVDLLGLLASCILPLVAAIYLCSFGYFKIISKSSVTRLEKTKSAKFSLKSSSKTTALVKKELSRLSVSPVFLVNTLFGPVLLLFCTIIAGINAGAVVDFLNSGGSGEEAATFTAEDIALLAPVFYLGASVVMCTMTSITSSMISLEGKSLALTKSLPVSSGQILLSKLLASLALALPLFFLSSICFIFEFQPSAEYAILSFILPVLVLTLTGIIGLLVNLKYPKLTAMSDAEVVKQSASSLISVFIGLGIGIASVAFLVIVPAFSNLDAPLILAGIYLVADFIFLKLLTTSGARKFRQIEV